MNAMHGSKRTEKTKKRTAPLERSRTQRQKPRRTNNEEFAMPILLHTEAAESLPSYRGWLSGCGWLWSQLHEPPQETTHYFDLSFEFEGSGSKRVCATAATTTTATVGGSDND